MSISANRLTTSACLLIVVLLGGMEPATAFRKGQPWDVTTRTEPDAETGGWYINLGITGARAMIEVEKPKVFVIKHVFAGTPASEKLEVGDRILGVGGQHFTAPHKFGYGVNYFGYEGPMMEFGNALEAAQLKPDGILELLILRGEEELDIPLTLPTKYGAFGKNYPYNCAKTDLILDELYGYLLQKQRDDGAWHGRPHINAFAALALLASGDPEHLPAAKRAAEYCARVTDDQISYGGLDCWKYTLYGTYLAEYYLITREQWVLSELDEINRWLYQAQMENGGWGHRPADRPGGNGYGAINVITMQAKMAWALMLRCGLEVDSARFAATHDFVSRGTNDIGYVWYKDGGKQRPDYADMGRTGASAIAHYLSPKGGQRYRDFSRLNAKCIGSHPTTFPDTHGSPLLGMAWTGLGALADPDMFRALMDHNRWHFALAQCPDGAFYYQPNRDNNPQDYQANPRLCASAVNALILSAKHRRLQMTGAKLVVIDRIQSSR